MGRDRANGVAGGPLHRAGGARHLCGHDLGQPVRRADDHETVQTRTMGCPAQSDSAHHTRNDLTKYPVRVLCPYGKKDSPLSVEQGQGTGESRESPLHGNRFAVRPQARFSPTGHVRGIAQSFQRVVNMLCLVCGGAELEHGIHAVPCAYKGRETVFSLEGENVRRVVKLSSPRRNVKQWTD